MARERTATAAQEQQGEQGQDPQEASAATVPPTDKVADSDRSVEPEVDADARAQAVGKARSVNAGRLLAQADETTLDDDVTMPSVTAPGDGPYDTTDPSEHATSVSPDKGAAARAGYGTVNAVLPIPDPSGRETVLALAAQEAGGGGDRIDRYDTVGPDGKVVTVEHNLDTGESRRV